MNASIPNILLTAALLLAQVFSLPAAQAESFRISTFNLNCRNYHKKQILSAIQATQADILFLQETTHASERFLQSALAASYPHFYATGYMGRIAEERLAFASKLPLRDLVFLPPSAGFFGFYCATCDIDKRAVKLIDVHLAPFLISEHPGIPEILTALGDAEEKHRAEVQHLSKIVDVRQPTIIAGDFNSLSTFVAPRRLREMGLIDGFAAVDPKPEMHPTWHGFLPLRLRLDYIFVTKHFEPH